MLRSLSKILEKEIFQLFTIFYEWQERKLENSRITTVSDSKKEKKSLENHERERIRRKTLFVCVPILITGEFIYNTFNRKQMSKIKMFFLFSGNDDIPNRITQNC